MTAIEQVLRGLLVCLMKASLYFPRHGKVQEAAADTLEAIQAAARADGRLVIGIRERQLIYKGRPLYDMSLYAVKLIDALRKRKAYGLSFAPETSMDELLCLVEFLTEKPKDQQVLDQAQEELESKGVIHISLERMPAEAAPGGVVLNTATDLADMYQDSISFLQEMVIDTKSGLSFDVSKALDLAENITNCVRQQRDQTLSFTSFKDYDEYTYNHSVNVCILAVALANTLTQDKALLVRIGEAALLHDVGKIFIPEEILYKPGRLTKEEYEVVKTHPERGARFLSTLRGVHNLSISAAFGHHLGYDRKGYPAVKGDMHLDRVTLIINMVDVYEALTSKRPYKKSTPCDQASAVLIDGAGTQFCPALVQSFIRLIGVYPPGTRVRLSTGEIGVVQGINRTHLDRPMVMVTNAADGGELPEPFELNTAALNPEGQFAYAVEKAVPAEV